MKKRILSLALSLLMLISLIPTAAFAADSVSITIGSVSANAGETVSVPVTISGAESAKFATMTIEFVVPSGLTITGATIGTEAAAVGLSLDQYSDYTAGKIIINGDLKDGSSPADGTLLTLQVNVDANASGSYTISGGPKDGNANNICSSDDAPVSCTFTAGTITVGSSTPVVNGYSASITVDPAEVEVNKNGTVKVNVTHNSDANFAAGEVVLTIPNNVAVADTGAVKNAAGADVSYKVNGTTLTIADYGAEKALGNGVYVITYTAGNTAGEASFALSSAAFSNKTNAVKSDLADATADQTAQVVDIINTPVTVSEDASSTGYFKFTTPARYGEAYTFYKEETYGAYYNYSAVQYKVGDGEWQTLTESNGSWTIPAGNVTGAITIKGTRAGITPTVTWAGTGEADITNKPTAQYGVNFVVTLPDDREPDTEPGYTYGITATRGEDTIGSYDATNRTYTIPGTAITGPFTVTVTKDEQAADQFKVTISSTPDLSTDVTASPTVVDKSQSTTLTLGRVPGYTYVIMVDGVDKTSEFDGDNTYDVENVQAAVSVEIIKTIDIANAKVTRYLGLDSEAGEVMWLITIAPDAGGSQLSNKFYTYNSNNMYWSDKYHAYCYLVKGTATAPTLAASNFAITDGNVTSVDYGMNVNMTNKVDANDAQLVYNMYNKVYTDFDANVTIEKFLRADVNGDALTKEESADAINVNDAAAIISAIVNGTANPTT